MPVPKRFYYTETRSGKRYKSDPAGTSGIVDLDRLRQGLPAWEDHQPIRVTLPGKLILADWTAQTWSYAKTKAVIARLSQLMQDGFEIYIWQSDGNGFDQVTRLNELHLTDLFDRKTRYKITLTDEAVVLDTASKKLPCSTLCLLDDYGISQLLQDTDEDIPRELPVEALSHIGIQDPAQFGRMMMLTDEGKEEQEKKLLLLRSKSPHYDILVSRDVDDVDTQYLNSLFSGLVAESKNESIIFYDVNKLKTVTPITAQNITCAYISSKSKDYPAIFKRLDHLEEIHTYTDGPDLGLLLQHAPLTLKYLSLSNVQIISPITKPLPTHTQLEMLIISTSGGGINISAETIEAVILASPNLRKIDFDCFQPSEIIFKSPVPVLPGLEELKLIIGGKEGKRLLLAAAPNLRKLMINIDEVETLDAIVNKESLEVLKLYHKKKLSNDNIKTLFTQFPNLKQLDIKIPNNINFSDLPALLDLEELDVSFSEINQSDLEKLIVAMPNLKQLNLFECKNIVEEELPGHIQQLLVKRPEHRERFHRMGRKDSKDHDVDDDKEDDDEDNEGVKVKGRGKPVDPTWNANDLKNEIPPSLQNKPFRYKGDTTKSQSMIAKKLCQYLTLTEQHIERIPKIQDGICLALSHFFIVKQKENSWDDFLNCVSGWDGKLETLTERLRSEFQNLYFFTKIYYESAIGSEKKHYLGDNVERFLLENRESRIIENAVHAIAIYPTSRATWLVYDPNYVEGAKEVAVSELSATIKKSMGNLLSVKSEIQPIPPKINNPELFIAEGGLLTLISSLHIDQLFLQLPQEDIYSRKALDGILLRHPSNGAPAWVFGLQYPETQQFTKYLLQLFIQHNRTDYKEKLKKSAELLIPYHLHEVMTHLIQLFPEGEQRVGLIETVRSIAPVNHYENRLATWHKKTHAHDSSLSFCKEISNGLIKKRLIEFNSTESVQGLRFALEDYCHKQKEHHPIFYIHSPDDFVCAAAYIERHGNLGVMKKGPGGALYDFLTAKQDKSAVPILVINYEKFHADDIVRLNALLDKKRSVDNIPLPDNMVVVGLVNVSNSECYQGSDFYSRFDVTETCPLSSQTLQSHIPGIVARIKQEDEKVFPIHLYHAQDWKNHLLGHWVLDNGNLVFKEGILKQALAQTNPIVIHNGLWNDAEFKTFWHEIERAYPGKEYIIADSYDWNNLITQCKPMPADATNLTLLNSHTLSEFFYQLHCEKTTHQLHYLPGYIEKARETKEKTLSVLVTEILSDDEWARIITSCQEQQITLQITHTANVTLPAALQALNSPIFTEKHHPSVFFSNDVDVAAILLAKRRRNVVTIDVTDLHPSDLVTRISGSFDNATLKYVFEEKKRTVLLELEKGNHVILKGHFSKELANALLPLLSTEVSSRITLISDNQFTFDSLIAGECEITPELKLLLLGNVNDDYKKRLIPHADTETFSQLRARLDFMRASTSPTSGDGAWQGLRDLVPHQSPEDDLLTAAQYNEKRSRQVRDMLGQAPYVFIAGLTGVGKSTFVEKHLCSDRDTLDIGEKNIKKWAQLPIADGTHYLFLDEATLSQRNWNEFEGLFTHPRGIIIDGEFHSLTEKHKVIFAGNPVSYGDERKLSSFFAKHGNAVVFDPMPRQVIDELILKPVLDLFKTDVSELKEYLLSVYRDLCALSKKEVLISPRELQMIALLTLSAHLRNQDLPLMSIAKQVAHDIVNPLLPKNKRVKREVSEQPCSVQSSDEFVVTPSRQAIIHRLDDLLLLRELRRESPEKNDALCYGGLGGVILEGDPGVGKSELVMRLLATHHFEEQACEDLKTPAKTERPFYRMPVNFSLEKKQELLLKAFREGAVVVIDEINSSPMMEALLNDLLMGKAPGNIRPEKPGFLVIGTQNPTTLAGRRAPSTALSRRLLTVDVPPYPREELMNILVSKGTPREQAMGLIDAYEKQSAHATLHRLKPPPTFRDLDRLADEVRNIANTASIQPHRLFSAVTSNKPYENGSKKTVQTRFF
ncbi:MAG: hypothetical protein A3I77_07590 [Gammaproteobacteria bacterium RIFCSPLOWO2_02_FULL_42_14]|nr:MAG: hypothetical protein A3B71_03420 [Gammaproteobacteria bacterium RIFCSPHIGHO2_02_FULL_42_43]OGT53019.1 MAG: hypothetical protein A3E54_08105 [Gammaproteobacteria bacterium RIFCSPHIGHO2_12_FULL_41_25]OGT61209.1 MAG: hypothetical protein A3I77_07590 [Gammaproteobacteria bacterium RIFCSPLOWO2_02_FULL_42_14]OGT87136.1 MAG: hypothetical protein A3G86_01310 [Gammaproteobacteria bacterium RIFCSPLOWO2_12_FULL_42_18]